MLEVRRQDIYIHKQSVVVSPNWFGTGSKGEWFFKKKHVYPKKIWGLSPCHTVKNLSYMVCSFKNYPGLSPNHHPFSPATEPAAGARTPGILDPAIFEGNTSVTMNSWPSVKTGPFARMTSTESGTFIKFFGILSPLSLFNPVCFLSWTSGMLGLGFRFILVSTSRLCLGTPRMSV